MHKATVFPLGNAETLRLDINDGLRKVLVDYADTRDPNNSFDLRCKLADLLLADLAAAKRKDYDAVAFTHLDDDHTCGAGDFFYFEHDKTRQGDDRIKMTELWVPAFAVLETNLDGDKLLIRKEARWRLKELGGKGVRVFSAPGTLKKWFEDNDLDLDDYRKRGIVLDAGKLVPSFSLANDNAEFFIHSPFASRTEDGELHVRNTDAIVMQAVFQCEDGSQTKFLITADVPYSQLDEIVRVTKLKKNEARLQWDIYDTPHHCSYTALGPEKGESKTKPSDNVKWLLEQGQPGSLIISSSDPIPNVDTDQPPHRQAAATYRDTASDHGGEFTVTMEHPKAANPKPLVIEITSLGAAIVREALPAAGVVATSQPAHRVG
ncbi:MAG: hypothetical protein JST30_01445 [Armatimonadetes bacterium]|nr:hypothetical protein [Armatimonadota bacterium]